MKYVALSILLILTLFACSSSKEVMPLSENKRPQITFSSGGGFAGTYTTYVLLDNGHIYKQGASEVESTPVGRVPEDEATQIFKNYDFLQLGSKDQLSYGNYTFSILKSDGSTTHKLQWEKGQPGTETLQLYYKNVMRIISKHKKAETKRSEKEFKPQDDAKKQ